MLFVLDGGDESKGAPVHVDGDLPTLAVHHGPGTVVVVLYHAKQRHIFQGRPGQSLPGGTDLAPAAVHQQK